MHEGNGISGKAVSELRSQMFLSVGKNRSSAVQAVTIVIASPLSPVFIWSSARDSFGGYHFSSKFFPSLIELLKFIFGQIVQFFNFWISFLSMFRAQLLAISIITSFEDSIDTILFSSIFKFANRLHFEFDVNPSDRNLNFSLSQ